MILLVSIGSIAGCNQVKPAKVAESIIIYGYAFSGTDRENGAIC